MKAERRHELKENDLIHAVESARKYLGEKGKQFGVVIILVGVVAAGIIFSVRSRAAAVEDIWRTKNQLSFTDLEVGIESLESLAAMTRDVTDKEFVFSSLFDQGTHALRLAMEAPAPPDPNLNDTAKVAFEQLLSRFPHNPLAIGVGHCGLASVEENSFVLDRDPAHKGRAEKHLQAVIDDPLLDGMPFKQIASDRLKTIDDTFTEVVFVYPVPENGGKTPAVQAAVEDGVLKIGTQGLEPVKTLTIKGTTEPVEEAENSQQTKPEEQAGKVDSDESTDPTDATPKGDQEENANTEPPERADHP